MDKAEVEQGESLFGDHGVVDECARSLMARDRAARRAKDDGIDRGQRQLGLQGPRGGGGWGR